MTSGGTPSHPYRAPLAHRNDSHGRVPGRQRASRARVRDHPWGRICFALPMLWI